MPTGDIAGYDKGAPTSVYTKTIIENFGREPAKFQARDYAPVKMPKVSGNPVSVTPKTRRVIGADIFVEWQQDAESLGRSLDKIVETSPFRLKMISNRGTKVYQWMHVEKLQEIDGEPGYSLAQGED